MDKLASIEVESEQDKKTTDKDIMMVMYDTYKGVWENEL